MTPSSKSKCSKNRRSFFTLIELLMVLMLVAFIGSAVGINLYQGIKSERFYRQVNQLAESMRAAQAQMIYAHNDIRFFFEKRNDTLRVKIQTNGSTSTNNPSNNCDSESEITEEEQTETAFAFLQKDRLELSEIENIFFINPAGKKEELQNIELLFTSPGGLMSKGHLHIFAKGDSEQIEPLYITLKGYPSHIKVSYEPEEIPEDEEPMRAFPQELLKELDKATS